MRNTLRKNKEHLSKNRGKNRPQMKPILPSFSRFVTNKLSCPLSIRQYLGLEVDLKDYCHLKSNAIFWAISTFWRSYFVLTLASESDRELQNKPKFKVTKTARKKDEEQAKKRKNYIANTETKRSFATFAMQNLIALQDSEWKKKK